MTLLGGPEMEHWVNMSSLLTQDIKWTNIKTFRRRLGRLLNILCTFNLRPVSTEFIDWSNSVSVGLKYGHQGTRNTAQKIKFSIEDFFSKCDQIHCFLRIRSLLLKKSLMENFIFGAVKVHRTPESLLVVTQKAESQNRSYNKTKHAEFTRKINIFYYPLIRPRTWWGIVHSRYPKFWNIRGTSS